MMLKISDEWGLSNKILKDTVEEDMERRKEWEIEERKKEVKSLCLDMTQQM